MSIYNQLKRKDINVFSGFHPLWQSVLNFWSGRIIVVKKTAPFLSVIQDLNQNLQSKNVIVFFDHHYAFDALPVGVLLANVLTNLKNVIVPYAIHLDMGVGREGEFSIRYYFRTALYRWFTNRVTKGALNIRFLPTVREFEMETPKLRQIVDAKYKDVNTRYIRSFIRSFSDNNNGTMCFLTPFSGIGFPGKPALHPQLYRSIDLVRMKMSQDASFYFAGAYPSWGAYRSYHAPLMTEHDIVIQGPFSIPRGDYENACNFLTDALDKLRKEANFIPPDYSRILMK